MKKVFLIGLLLIALTLSACGSASTPTAIPTINLDGDSNPSEIADVPQISGQGGVTASGIVTTFQDAHLAFALAGSVSKVHVAVGDQVQAGDILVELDNAAFQSELELAQRTVRELTSQASIAAAEQDVANAQKTYADAEKKVNSINNRYADNVTINYLKDQVTLAQAALDRAREAYNQTAGLSAVDPARAAAAINLYNAQKAYNTALGNLSWYTDEPSENDVALVKANFDSASAALQEAQWYLSELKGETIPAEATGTKLAQLQQARSALKAAQNALEKTQLQAPFSGTITNLDIVAGEYVSPGQTIAAMSDVEHLQVITTDLSERDVTSVAVGQEAAIIVEALNQEIKGHVITISSVADTLGGDVVYKTTIALDELPEGIRVGMSVTVHFQP